MAIKHLVTAGYGNGTFSGTIPLVVTRGYGVASGSGRVFCVDATDVYRAGAVIAEAFSAGAIAEQVFIPGAVAEDHCG